MSGHRVDTTAEEAAATAADGDRDRGPRRHRRRRSVLCTNAEVSRVITVCWLCVRENKGVDGASLRLAS